MNDEKHTNIKLSHGSRQRQRRRHVKQVSSLARVNDAVRCSIRRRSVSPAMTANRKPSASQQPNKNVLEAAKAWRLADELCNTANEVTAEVALYRALDALAEAEKTK